jgi:hypothetical protein
MAQPATAVSMAAKQRQLHRWLLRHGASMDSIELRPSATGQWGAFATRALDAGQPVAAIPQELILSEDAVRSSQLATDARRAGITASTRTLTYIFMLLQRADPTSHWGPYLRAIPGLKDLGPLGWGAAQLAHLAGTNLLATGTMPHTAPADVVPNTPHRAPRSPETARCHNSQLLLVPCPRATSQCAGSARS